MLEGYRQCENCGKNKYYTGFSEFSDENICKVCEIDNQSTSLNSRRKNVKIQELFKYNPNFVPISGKYSEEREEFFKRKRKEEIMRKMAGKPSWIYWSDNSVVKENKKFLKYFNN